MNYLRAVQQWYTTYEKRPRLTLILVLAWLAAIATIAFLLHLGSTGLVDETEPMFAEAARQMVITGDWVTPYFNDATRFDKPPLIYWLMAIAYQIVGFNAWGARLPSAFAAIALLFVLFFTLKRFGFATAKNAQDPESVISKRQVWLSAAIGASLIPLNIHLLVWGRTGVSDMLLCATFGITLLSFFWGYGSGGKPENSWLPHRGYIAFYIFMALAVLTKGPVGLVLPGLIILAFLFYLGKFREVFQEAKPIFGGILFSVITVPWYVLVIQRNGDAYINSFFGYHNFDRFTEVVNGHQAPWYFYFLVVLVGFIPWSIYLPLAIARLKIHHRQKWQSQPRNAHLGLFAFFWFALVFGFFTIAVTKLPSYTIPLIPAASMLVALLWGQMITEPQKNSLGFQISCGFNILFTAILAGFMWYSPKVVGYDPAAPDLSRIYAASNIPWHGAMIWGLATILLGYFWWRRSRLGFELTSLLAMLTFILFTAIPTGFLLDQTRQAPLRALAADMLERRQPHEEIVMVGFEKPSLVFYGQHPIHFFDYTKETVDYLHQELDPQADSILFIAKQGSIDKLEIPSGTVDNLQQYGPYELMRLHHPQEIKLKTTSEK